MIHGNRWLIWFLRCWRKDEREMQDSILTVLAEQR